MQPNGGCAFIESIDNSCHLKQATHHLLDVEQTLETSPHRAAAVPICLTRHDDEPYDERAIIQTVMKATTITKFAFTAGTERT